MPVNRGGGVGGEEKEREKKIDMIREKDTTGIEKSLWITGTI